jgi:hypothetical protein
VDRGGNDMLFHDEQQGIWIGHYQNVGRELKPGERFSYTALSEMERWERTSVEMIKTDLTSGIPPEQIVTTLARWQSERGDEGFFRGLVERAMTPEQKTQWHHGKTVEMPTAAIKQTLSALPLSYAYIPDAGNMTESSDTQQKSQPWGWPCWL